MVAVWSESYPGNIVARCSPTAERFDVHNHTGRIMRQSSEARLCFKCGPDGGVYHPDRPDGKRRLLMDELRSIAADHDAYFNKFEVHEHTRVEGGGAVAHSHTDGSDVHRHEDYGWAKFTISKEDAVYYRFGVGSAVKFTTEPSGPGLSFIEATDEERVFRVVVPYQYNNPGTTGAGVYVRKMGAAKPSSKSRARSKPRTEWGRADWRESMEHWIAASGQPGTVVIGASAIALSALRMKLNYRLTPIYVIGPPAGPTAPLGARARRRLRAEAQRVLGVA